MQIVCGNCGAKMRVPDDAVGKKGKCPKCGNTFTIAVPGSAAAEPPASDEPPPVDEAVAESVTAAPPPLPSEGRRRGFVDEDDEDDEEEEEIRRPRRRRARRSSGGGLAQASMICGIVGLSLSTLLICCCPYVGLIPAVLAITFGFIAQSQGDVGKGMATTGIILGFVTFALVVGLVLIGLIFNVGGAMLDMR